MIIDVSDLPIADLKKLVMGEINRGLELEAKATAGPWSGNRCDSTEEYELKNGSWWGKFPANASECLIEDFEGNSICCTNDDGIATEREASDARFITHARNIYRPMAEMGLGICVKCPNCYGFSPSFQKDCSFCAFVRPILIAFICGKHT